SRQIGINPHQPAVITASCRGIEMDHLAGSVHAGIGPACASNIYRVIGDLWNGRFKSGLYRGFIMVFLALPAVETSTVVFHDRSVALQFGHSNQAILLSKERASVFCWSLPSCMTSCSSSRAPSKSSISM